MSLTFRFGVPESFARPSPEGGLTVGVACPALAGPAEERWPLGAGALAVQTDDSGWVWGDNTDFRLGAVTASVTDDTLEAVTRRLYDALFAATAGRHLYRIWHFVPRITESAPGELENYQKFCRARATAFEGAYAKSPELRMPAASAVGVDGDRLVIVAVAGAAEPEHFENPEQVPAYRYPERYGPKSPSFARATRVRVSDAVWTFISGTAAIKGSESLYPENAGEQATVTADNLRLMLARVTGEATPHAAWSRLYLGGRISPETAGHAVPTGFRAGVGVVRAAICRAELLVECELSHVRYAGRPAPREAFAG